MVQTLQAIKGGGGSIKVGTIGTISSLMTRELQSSTSSTLNIGDEASSSSDLTDNTDKQQKETLENDKGSSNVSKGSNRKKTVDVSGRIRSHRRSSRDTQLEKIPLREKARKKGTNMVDIADVTCGNSAGSLSNRLKKLGFSRLTQSFM